MTNKTNEVLKYLQKNKEITSEQAINFFGATRLSAIIFKLRKRGYNIITKREEIFDRYGNYCPFARYVYLGMKMTPEDVISDIFGDVFPCVRKKK